MELRIPKLRTGSYFPSFLEPRRLAAKAIASVVQEAYVHGVQTCSVDDLVRVHDDAIVRLVGAILMEQNDEWAVQRARYMTLETIVAISDIFLVILPAVAA